MTYIFRNMTTGERRYIDAASLHEAQKLAGEGWQVIGVAHIPRCPESVQSTASVPDEDREDRP